MPAACSVSPEMAGREQIRAFIAIELPPDFKRGLAELRDRLDRPGQDFLKWVAPDTIHLTLKFLGNIPLGSVGAVSRAMRQAAGEQPPFSLHAAATGAFPNSDRVQVAWVGLGGDLKALGRLQQRLEALLVPLGFPSEKRPFTAHLTLARVRDNTAADRRASFGRRLVRGELPDCPAVYVSAISLFQSRLTPAGAVHTRLAEAKLNLLSAV